MRWLMIAMLALPMAAAAQPLPANIGPGNLPPDFYPRSTCEKPDLSMIGRKPGDARDVKAVEAYNKQVQAYNQSAPVFNACVQDYAAKARNDMERIRAAIQDANTH
jgi:hypothetical protein